MRHWNSVHMHPDSNRRQVPNIQRKYLRTNSRAPMKTKELPSMLLNVI